MKMHLRKGRVKEYIKREYGKKAFTERGTIKEKYLTKAYKSESLKKAIRLAKTMRKWH